jgi:hypothetical protein
MLARLDAEAIKLFINRVVSEEKAVYNALADDYTDKYTIIYE